MAAARKSRARECKGRHRKANRDTAHMRWLGAGAVAVGLGAAMATGQGVAAADTGSDADASSSASSSDAAGPSSSADAAESDSASSAGPASSDSTSSKPDKPSAKVSASTVQSSKADEDSEDSTDSDTETESPDAVAASPSSPEDDVTDAGDAATDGVPAPESQGSADESETELPAAPSVDTGESSEPDVVDPPSDADPVDTPDVPVAAMPAELPDTGSDTSTTDATPSATDPPASTTAATQVVSDTAAGSDAEPDARVALQVAPALSLSTQSVSVAMAAPEVAAEPVHVPAFLTGPITLRNVVSDVLTWLGLPQFASTHPVSPAPLPPLVESLWLVVRRFQYTFNNDRPIASPTISGQNIMTGVITGKVNAADYDDDHLTYTVSGEPAHGSVSVDAAGNFVYTPDAAFAETGGQDAFTVTIDDRPGNPWHIHGLLDVLGCVPDTTATVKLTVVPINHAPTITVTPAGQPNPSTGASTYQITATDRDPGDSPTVAITDLPDHGTLVANGGGSYTYTPDRAYAHANPDGASDSFTVTASDGRGGIATETEQISVPFVNAAPVLTAHNDEPDPQTGVITGVITGTDPDGDTLTYTTATQPAKGSLSVNPQTGQWTYTPSEAARIAAAAPTATPADKQDQFEISVSDGYTATVATVGVPIVGLPDSVIDVGDNPKDVAFRPDGAYAYVVNTNSGTVSVIDAASRNVVATLPVGGQPTDVAVHPNGTRAYVADFNGNVIVIDTVNNNVIGSMSVGGHPQDVAFRPDGAYAYVTKYDFIDEQGTVNDRFVGTIEVIDTATNSRVGTISIPSGGVNDFGSGQIPGSVVFSPDGTYAYVTVDRSQTHYAQDTVIVIDTVTNRVLRTVEVGITPVDVAFRPDGEFAYITKLDRNVTVIDTVIGTIPVGGNPTKVAFSNIIGAIPLGDAPQEVAFSPDGTRAYITTLGDTLLVIDTATNTVTPMNTVGGNPTSVAVSPDGSRLYVTNSDGTVSVIAVAPSVDPS